MAKLHYTVFKCDRCGNEATIETDIQNPSGWEEVTIPVRQLFSMFYNTRTIFHKKLLCNVCCQEYNKLNDEINNKKIAWFNKPKERQVTSDE